MEILNFYKIGKVLGDNQVYIGRAMPNLGLNQSVFANPFKLSSSEDRASVIENYRVWLYSQILCGNITKQHFLDLKGKDLVFFASKGIRK